MRTYLLTTVNMMHPPPVRSEGVTDVCSVSLDLPVTPPPLTRPNTMMAT